MASIRSVLRTGINRTLGLVDLQVVHKSVLAPLPPQETPPNHHRDAVRRRCQQIARFSNISFPDAAQASSGINRDAHEKWFAGLIDELEFWYLTVALDGWTWKESYQMRLAGNMEFQYSDYFRDSPDQRLDVLDVGAGALPAIGTIMPGREIVVTATDPLGEAYRRIFEDFGITGSEIIRCDAELLAKVFGAERFHFVLANNCLDHCYDPLKAIKNIYEVTKRGGWALLDHYENVGENEHYSGLHQWNFSEREGRLVVWNRTASCFVDEHLPPDAKIVVTRAQDQNWISALVTKPA